MTFQAFRLSVIPKYLANASPSIFQSFVHGRIFRKCPKYVNFHLIYEQILCLFALNPPVLLDIINSNQIYRYVRSTDRGDIMKQKLTAIIKKFRSRHRFAATLLSMILLCFLLCVLAYFFLINTVLKKSRENSIQLNQSYISTEADNTNQLIYQLHQSLTQLSYSRSILNMVFYSEYKESNKNLVTTDLALTAQNNLLIKSALLYIPDQNLVITSGYRWASLEQSAYNDMITDYLNDAVHPIIYEDTEKISYLFFYDDSLIMARDFPLNGSRRLGTLFYRVNYKEIYTQLTHGLNEGYHIWVYDTDNHPVFSGITDYPDYITDDTIAQLESPEENYHTLKNSVLFYSRSNLLEWKFLYEVKKSALFPIGNAVSLMLIPSLILLAACGIFICLSVTSGVYLPRQIKGLLELIDSETVSAAQEEDDETKNLNEFEHLNRALSQMAGQQTKLQTAIDKVSGDVLSRFFLELLSGAQFTPEQARQMLSLAHSNFGLKGFYMAGILHCKGDLTGLEKKRHVILSEIEEQMSSYNKEHHSQSHILTIDSRTFVLILSFGITESLLKVIKEVSELEQVINAVSSSWQIPVEFHIGRIYYSILDVGFSYQSALETIPDTTPKSEPETSGISKVAVKAEETNIKDRARQVLSLVLDHDTKNASALSARVIAEIKDSGKTPTDEAEQYKAYISALSHGISRLDYIDPSAIPNELLIFKDAESADSQQLARCVSESCEKIIENLHKMLKRQQNPYILSAQDYIRRHFSDSGLSLNTVAEAIDVNPSYLSKLFKSNLNINFTDYLNHYRIECSLKLLSETNRTLQDISVDSGFNSVQNYIRVFKKFMNMTPGQYRKEI